MSDQLNAISSLTGVLGTCSQYVDPSPYEISCVYDLCRTQPDNDIICNTVEQYVRTCQEASNGTVEIGNWRQILTTCSKSFHMIRRYSVSTRYI